ncbi:hypothetical protein BDY19DRAFT_932423 [Irpex rosettiformis]|uniref:Uncharacterized protein n=1 Tax=Irpex rosettiformis TaxID=378272 RepID=A0ACB8U9M0_9APHY|nr:hypothetical protein BDY19DRAFT_932423 [Irpex rosettiformis]
MKECLQNNALARISFPKVPLYSSDDDSDDSFFFDEAGREETMDEALFSMKKLSVVGPSVEGDEDSMEWIGNVPQVELLPCDDSEDGAMTDVLPLDLVTRGPTTFDLPGSRILLPQFRNADEMQGLPTAHEERHAESRSAVASPIFDSRFVKNAGDDEDDEGDEDDDEFFDPDMDSVIFEQAQLSGEFDSDDEFPMFHACMIWSILVVSLV